MFIPQALGADEYLRVTWHEGRRVMVFSHWDGDTCVAATPVRVSDLGGLAAMMVSAVVHDAAVAPWPPPSARDRQAFVQVAERSA